MPFEIQYPTDGTNLTLEEVVSQALGAASKCWEKPEAAGEFDSNQITEICDALVNFIREGIPNLSSDFSHDLEHLLNSHCCENGSNTPDFILATYMKGCLDLFDTAVKAREEWYGRKLEIGGG